MSLFVIQSRILEQFARRRIPYQRTQQQMFDTQVIITQGNTGTVRSFQGRTQTHTHLRLDGCALHTGLKSQCRRDRGLKPWDVDPRLL